MKPIVLPPEQWREIERRRKDTLDRRVYQRLTAVLTIAEGNSREEVAHLLGISLTQLVFLLTKLDLNSRACYAVLVPSCTEGDSRCVVVGRAWCRLPLRT
jgi:hypothetical protein